jgi:SAM-dependent methyltransferase
MDSSMVAAKGVQADSLWPEYVCPVDLQALEARADFLVCPEGHRYPEVRGIPRFVTGTTYADHFGAQWKRYRTTQLDSYTGRPISRDRLRRCVGEQLWNKLEKLQILECGCGAGRFTEVLLAQGGSVTSVDLSEAVDANLENCPLSDSHRIAQGDILQLPFRKQQFDLVLCLGVIQHTPSPENTIRALADQVRPGGHLILDHYTYELGWFTKTAPLFRMVLKRLPTDVSMRFTERMVEKVLPLHKRVSRSRLRSIVFRISPVLTHYVTYPELSDEIQRQWALLDTHDSLTDWHKHFRTRNQIRRTLLQLGFEEVWCEYGGNGVEARAQRPAAPPGVLGRP